MRFEHCTCRNFCHESGIPVPTPRVCGRWVDDDSISFSSLAVQLSTAQARIFPERTSEWTYATTEWRKAP